MQTKKKKRAAISILTGSVIFLIVTLLIVGIITFLFIFLDGNSALQLKVYLSSEQHSSEEKIEYAKRYMYNFAKELEEDLYKIEFDNAGKCFSSSSDASPNLPGIEVPGYLMVEDVSKGDIGNDGTEEIAVVLGMRVNLLNGKEYVANGSRILCIYRQTEDGSYELWKTNDVLIRAFDYDDIFTDFGLTYITEEGELCYILRRDLNNYNHHYYFDMYHDDLIMIRYEIGTAVRNWNELLFFTEGKVETYYTAPDTGEEYFVGEESFEPCFIAFEDMGDASVMYPEYAFQGYLPLEYRREAEYYYWTEASEWLRMPTHTGSNVLDYVKDTCYPEMIRVEMCYSDEVIENNAEIIGYRFPTYYYRDAQGNYLYFCDTSPVEPDNAASSLMRHIVCYRSHDGNTEFYAIADETLEISEYR